MICVSHGHEHFIVLAVCHTLCLYRTSDSMNGFQLSGPYQHCTTIFRDPVPLQRKWCSVSVYRASNSIMTSIVTNRASWSLMSPLWQKERRRMVKRVVYLWFSALLGYTLLPRCSTQGELHVQGLMESSVHDRSLRWGGLVLFYQNCANSSATVSKAIVGMVM